MSNQIENYAAHLGAVISGAQAGNKSPPPATPVPPHHTHNDGRYAGDRFEHNISRQLTDFLGCNSCYPNTNGGQRRDLRGPRSVVGGLAEWQSAPVDDCMHSCTSCQVPGSQQTTCQNASERHLKKGPCYSSAESRLFRPGIGGMDEYLRGYQMRKTVDTTLL